MSVPILFHWTLLSPGSSTETRSLLEPTRWHGHKTKVKTGRDASARFIHFTCNFYFKWCTCVTMKYTLFCTLVENNWNTHTHFRTYASIHTQSCTIHTHIDIVYTHVHNLFFFILNLFYSIVCLNVLYRPLFKSLNRHRDCKLVKNHYVCLYCLC